jgi:hypothetical protein
MAEVVPLGHVKLPVVNGQAGGHTGHIGRRASGPGFGQALAAIMARNNAPRNAAATGGVQNAVFRVPFTARRPPPPEKPASVIPAQSDAALQQAMNLERVPQSWRSGLEFIMAQESTGKVDARNPVHSARGLFQLTRAHYHLNPHGERSFGNAVEEAQGGIRYIQQRYGTADNAVAFWRQHRWY